jgi:hypothetical protein
VDTKYQLTSPVRLGITKLNPVEVAILMHHNAVPERRKPFQVALYL